MGFLDAKMGNDGRLFTIAEKGLKLIGKYEKKVESDKVVNEGKSALIIQRGKAILNILKKKGMELTIKDISKELKHIRMELTYDMVYQALDSMVKDGSVNVRRIKNINYYSIPRLIPVREDPEVVIHEPKEILNQVQKADNRIMTIGQVLDMVWNKASSVECRKPRSLKNQDSDSIIARFKDQKTLLEVRDNLPGTLKEKMVLTTDPRNKKNHIYIPII